MNFSNRWVQLVAGITGMVAVANFQYSWTLFVQPQVIAVAGNDGSRGLLDDLLAGRFLIATTTADAQAWLDEEAIAAWHRIGGERVVISRAGSAATLANTERGVLHVAEIGGLFAGWVEAHRVSAVVVRPDRYVFGAARDAGQLNRLVRAVLRHVT